MPIYTFVCPHCDHEEEALLKHAERDWHVSWCPVDGATLVWKGVESPTLDFNGNAAGRFQMKAITGQGQKVAGHFGKSARRK